MASLRLDKPAKAVEDLIKLNTLSNNDPEFVYWLVVARARLSQKAKARADLAEYDKAYLPEYSRRSLAVVVAAELNEGTEGAIAAMDGEVAKQRDDPRGNYEAARAFALASKPVSRRDPACKDRAAARRPRGAIAEARLRRANRRIQASFNSDPALDPIRGEPPSPK